jgi:hypothetical protein
VPWLPIGSDGRRNRGILGKLIRKTSEATTEYNCIAWAAGEDDRWWWPVGPYYWPSTVPRVESIQAFTEAYGTLGYSVCQNGSAEPGLQKVAIYIDSRGIPTHAARQLMNGEWTSKLGREVDVRHDTPEALLQRPELQRYGAVGIYLKRTRSA